MRYEHILPTCNWCGADITEDRLRQLGARIYRREFLYCDHAHAKLARCKRASEKPGESERVAESMRRLRAERKLKIMLDKAFGVE